MTPDADDPGGSLLAGIAEHYREGRSRGFACHPPAPDRHDLKTTPLATLIDTLATVGRPPTEHGRPARRKRALLRTLLTIVHALAERGPAAAPARDVLIGILDDPSARLRYAAVDALAWMGAAADAIPALLARLARDREPSVRHLAAWALGELGSSHPEVIAALVPELDAACPRTREAAALGLGKLARGDAALGQLLEDNFVLDDVNRPALAVALARAAPDRLVGLVVSQPHIFWECDRAAPWPASPVWPASGPHAHSLASFNRTRPWHDRPTCAQILMRLATLDADAAPVREVFVRMIRTPACDAALHGLARVGAAAQDALPAITPHSTLPAREAARAIAFAAWRDDEERAKADESRWRERMLDRLRRQWDRRLVTGQSRAAIEECVRTESRSRILYERRDAGDLPPERIALAALLGDEAARRVMGWREPDADPPDAEAFEKWARAFDAVPIDARVRIAHAATREAIAIWHECWPECDRGTAALHAIEDWLLEPGSAARNRLARNMDFGTTQGDDHANAVWALRTAADLVLTPESASSRGCCLPGALAAWVRYTEDRREKDSLSRLHMWDAPIDTAPLIRRLRRGVREWVVPWALGEADPVVEPLACLFTDYPTGPRGHGS